MNILILGICAKQVIPKNSFKVINVNNVHRCLVAMGKLWFYSTILYGISVR